MVNPLSESDLDSFYAYAKANKTEPNGEQSQWADYTIRIIEELREWRGRRGAPKSKE